MYRAKRIEKNGATMRTNTQPDCCACDRTLQKARVPEVIIPGSGYGRNSATFVRAGFEVTGIEISDTALNLACQGSPEVRYHLGRYWRCLLTIRCMMVSSASMFFISSGSTTGQYSSSDAGSS